MSGFELDRKWQLAISQFSTLRENLFARYQYAEFLSVAAKNLMDGSMPNMRPESEVPRDRLLRCIHIALAAEVYKSTEVLGLLCANAMEAPEQQFMRIVNGAPGADSFYSSMSTRASREAVRHWLPIMDPRGLPGLDEDERLALETVDATVCNIVSDAVALAAKTRKFLAPYRHRFSHTYGLILYGSPARDGSLLVPSIARDVDWSLAPPPLLEGCLIASLNNNARLIELLTLFMETEALLLNTRLNGFAQGEPCLLPIFLTPRGTDLDLVRLKTCYESAFRKLGLRIATVTIEQEFQVKEERLAAAMAFYDALRHTQFAVQNARESS